MAGWPVCRRDEARAADAQGDKQENSVEETQSNRKENERLENYGINRVERFLTTRNEEETMDRIAIAARIGDAQYRLASGEDSIEVEKDLIRLRKEIVASAAAVAVDTVSDDILAHYRADAIAQLIRLREMLAEMDMQTSPDMQLFHISACAELARQKVVDYYAKRNRAAACRVQEGMACQA